MILKSLWLTNFKNYSNSKFDFINGINCVLGKNGKGKTNLLDAIYYLSFTKSAVGSQDRFSIFHEAPAFALHAIYSDLIIALQFEKGKTKSLKINNQEPKKLSDVIGRVPLVLVLPDDTGMIREGSEERRKFFDGALSQFDKNYLTALLSYNKLLKQRNTLLKQNESRSIDYKLVETYDDQLIPLSMEISSKRVEMKQVFLPFLQKNYEALHEGGEVPDLMFKSQVDKDFEKKFKANFEKDRIMQRTLLGCHKDDFTFLLDEGLIKKFGSQGQQKTFIIALKLALYDFLKEKTKKRPLLLLDDIFDKLDDSRIGFLVLLLQDSHRFGQVFITDAGKDRSKALFRGGSSVNFIELV